MIIKEDIRNAVKTILRMNKFVTKVESLFGKSYDDTELDCILSEMVTNLCELVSLNDDQIDEVSNILFDTEPSKNDVIKAINILCDGLPSE